MKNHFYTGTGIPEVMFAVARTVAKLPAIIRLAGGMNNDASEIYPFFRTALRCFDGGILMSGGTRCWTDDGKMQASVAEVVVDIHSFFPGILTMGSFPMTEGTDESGRGDHTEANPDTHHVAMIKGKNGETLGWDGDVDEYIKFMKRLHDEAGFNAGVIVWNGGGVTVTETTKARDAGFDIFVVTGSGRACDDKLSAAKFTGDRVWHVSKNDPEQLEKLLLQRGLSK